LKALEEEKEAKTGWKRTKVGTGVVGRGWGE